MTGGLGALTKGGCAENSIDSCTQAQKQNNILYRPKLDAMHDIESVEQRVSLVETAALG